MALNDVWGIVLAGTYSQSKSSLDGALPRPLWPVANTPLICHALHWLRAAGIRRATICANSNSPVVRRVLYDGEALDVDLAYYEDWMPRGPAGCVRDAGTETDAETFVVVDSTTVPRADMADLLAEHRRSRAGLTVVASKPTGNVSELDGRLSPLGVCVFSRRVLEHIPKVGYYDVKEMLIPELRSKRERVSVHVTAESCVRVMDVDSYLAANEWLLDRVVRAGRYAPGYRAVNHCLLHESVQLEPTATLIGPVLAGPGATIAADSTLVGPTVLGAGSVIGERAIVCRSVLWNHCQIGNSTILDRCIVAHDAQLRAGSRHHDSVLGLECRDPAAGPRSLAERRQLEAPIAGPMPAATGRSEAIENFASTEVIETVRDSSK